MSGIGTEVLPDINWLQKTLLRMQVNGVIKEKF